MRLVVLGLAASVLAPQPAGATEAGGVTVVLASDKAVYAPAEPITLTLRVVNPSPQPVRLSFRTAQRFDLVLEDAQGREVWRWSTGRMFAQVLGEETLGPSGGEFVARATAEGKFPPQIYTVKGIIPAMQGALTASATVTVR